jgi:hypothetical protein
VAAKRNPVQWKPKAVRGRRMASFLKKGRSERIPLLLSGTQVDQELKERRGRGG